MIDDVDIVQNEATCQKDINRFFSANEIKEINIHAKEFGYKPWFYSQRYHYAKLKILLRQKKQRQTRTLNDRID